MIHHTPLIATLVAGLGLAFIFGTLAQRLKISPLIGYLTAGVAVGPFTPGFVADQALAPELAELGVILLMFGVGLHFSMKDLMSVKNIAIPGAVVQIAFATLLGWGMAMILGWSHGAGLVFGLALSVASTVVLLRALQERKIVDSHRGRIAVGWLIVEDLAMVLTLVLLPALAGLLSDDGQRSTQDLLAMVGLTLVKVGAFVALMLIVGRRVIPWVLHYIAHTGSRELFRLSVLAIALGVAYGASALFGVSFALGAFFAGMVLSESELSHRAAEETLPLRDAFAVLFFVSVGMLFDPGIILRNPVALLATLFIITIGKSVAAFAIVRLFRHSQETALTISASLAQIGEFSFILATLGVSLNMLPPEGRDLILAGAILSILANPVIFAGVDRLLARQRRKEQGETEAAPAPVHTPTSLTGHAIIIGYGRVGSVVGDALKTAGRPYLVIEDRPDMVEKLQEAGTEVLSGNAVLPEVLHAANLAGAHWLFVAIPNSFEAARIVEQARKFNPALRIAARAHGDADVGLLTASGADHTVMGEREIARGMVAWACGGETASTGETIAPPAEAAPETAKA